MATFTPITPNSGFFDSGISEEIFETQERPSSPATLYSESLFANQALVNDPTALRAIFKQFEQTILAPVQQQHAQDLDATVAQVRAQERSRVQDELAINASYADESFEEGRNRGLQECSHTHNSLIEQAYTDRQALMNSFSTQTESFGVNVGTQCETEAPVRKHSFSIQTEEVNSIDTGTDAFVIPTKSVSIQTESPNVVEKKTSTAAKASLALLGVGVGAVSAFTAMYLKSSF